MHKLFEELVQKPNERADPEETTLQQPEVRVFPKEALSKPEVSTFLKDASQHLESKGCHRESVLQSEIITHLSPFCHFSKQATKPAADSSMPKHSTASPTVQVSNPAVCPSFSNFLPTASTFTIPTSASNPVPYHEANAANIAVPEAQPTVLAPSCLHIMNSGSANIAFDEGQRSQLNTMY